MSNDQKKWPQHLFQGNAVKYIEALALEYCKGDGIDFGAGKWCLRGAIPVDHSTYFGLDDFSPASLDFIFSSHCLEHIKDWKQALKDWLRLLKPNGIIFLYLPHEQSPWTGWRKHKWVPTAQVIIDYLGSLNIRTIKFSAVPDEYCSFYIIGEKKP